MSQVQAALAGAGIAAVTAILAAGLTGFIQLRLERIRQVEARRIALMRDMMTSVAEVFRQMFVIQHHIQNLCWFAIHNPSSISQHIPVYYKAVDEAWPVLWGSTAVVASIDINAYSAFHTLIDDIAHFESDVAATCERYQGGDSEALEWLQQCYHRAADEGQDMPRQLATAMASILPGITDGRNRRL